MLFKKLYIFLILLVLIVLSCTSPMDIDTPRKKIVTNNGSHKMHAFISQVSIEINGFPKDIKVMESTIQIDTSVFPPAMWLKAKMDINDESILEHRITLSSIEFNLDSIGMNGAVFKIYSNTDGNNWLKYLVNRGTNRDYDTVVYADTRNISEFSCNVDYVKNDLWSSLYAIVKGQKVWQEKIDSVIHYTVTKTVIDTIYVNNMPVPFEKKITEEKDSVISRYFERRALDSLRIKGKIHIEY